MQIATLSIQLFVALDTLLEHFEQLLLVLLDCFLMLRGLTMLAFTGHASPASPLGITHEQTRLLPSCV